MAKRIVTCRICKEKFDRNDPNLIEGIDYVKPSERMYYHKKCYEIYQLSRDDIHAVKNNEIWFTATWELLTKHLKYDFNYLKVQKQWESYLKNKMTAKGIYFALKYFYEIKKGDVTKSEHGIGIVPHIYQDSAAYWQEREKTTRSVCEDIEKQIIQSNKKEVAKRNIKKSTKKSYINNLKKIADMEDD